jgi:general secretion pathway protein F
MSVYQYEALDSAGSTIRGTLDAESDEAAREALRVQGLYPTELNRQEMATTSSAVVSFGPGLRDIAMFTRQLGTLLEAGFTMIESLDTVLGQTANARFAGTVADLKDRVNRGESLSLALAEHEAVFSKMYVSMVMAGEQAGRLPDVLSRVADYYDKRIRLKNKVLVSLAYPALMSVVGVGILIFLVTFIAPTLTEVFKDNEQQLPLPTEILMATSTFLGTYWPLLLALLAIVAFAIRHYINTENGKRYLDHLSITLPIIGSLTMNIAIARFARTFGVLLESGVEILQSFEITGRVLDNALLMEALEKAKEQVEHGGDVASSLSVSGLFPRILVDMVAAGQKSGRLAQLLVKVADDLDEQVETQLALITSLIEPIMILVMGLAVGGVVLAVVLPIFQMNRMY